MVTINSRTFRSTRAFQEKIYRFREDPPETKKSPPPEDAPNAETDRTRLADIISNPLLKDANKQKAGAFYAEKLVQNCENRPLREMPACLVYEASRDRLQFRVKGVEIDYDVLSIKDSVRSKTDSDDPIAPSNLRSYFADFIKQQNIETLSDKSKRPYILTIIKSCMDTPFTQANMCLENEAKKDGLDIRINYINFPTEATIEDLKPAEEQ